MAAQSDVGSRLSASIGSRCWSRARAMARRSIRPRLRSSDGQSGCLLSSMSQVRVLPGAPQKSWSEACRCRTVPLGSVGVPQACPNGSAFGGTRTDEMAQRRTSKRTAGSIRRLPSGRYQARIRADDGERRTAPVTFGTKVEADRWLASAVSDRADRMWIDPKAGRVVFRRFPTCGASGSPRRPKRVGPGTVGRGDHCHRTRPVGVPKRIEHRRDP